MSELAPCVIEKHNTQVTVETLTTDRRYHFNFVVRGRFTGELLGKLSLDTGDFTESMNPEKSYLVADSIYRALQIWPESHPHIMDALTWEPSQSWDDAVLVLEAARSGSLQPA